MPYLKFLFFLLMSQAALTLFQFSESTDKNNWKIVNDGVMGGRSRGQISVSEDGHGVFEGRVSLENNGGFTLVQYSFTPVDVSGFSSLEIRVKGDGKKYQVRLKSSSSQYYNYACTIQTSGKWESIRIPFGDFLPQFRGMQLKNPAFPGENMAEVAILIGNKKEEDFRIEIDKLSLR